MFEGSGDEKLSENYTWYTDDTESGDVPTYENITTDLESRVPTSTFADTVSTFLTTTTETTFLTTANKNMSLTDTFNDYLPRDSNEMILMVLLIICLLTFLLVIGIICYLCRLRCKKQRIEKQSKSPVVNTMVSRGTSVSGLHGAVATTLHDDAQYERKVDFKNNVLSPVSMLYENQNYQISYLKEQNNQNQNSSNHVENSNKLRKHSTPVPPLVYRNSDGSTRYDPLVMTVITPVDDASDNGQTVKADDQKFAYETAENAFATVNGAEVSSHEMYDTAKSDLTSKEATQQEALSKRHPYNTETLPLLTSIDANKGLDDIKPSQTQPVSWFVPLDGLTHEPLRHSFVDLSNEENAPAFQQMENNLMESNRIAAILRQKDNLGIFSEGQVYQQNDQRQKIDVSRSKKKISSDTDNDSLIQENSGSSNEHLSPNVLTNELISRRYISSLSEDSGLKGEDFWEFDEHDMQGSPANMSPHESPAKLSPTKIQNEWQIRENRPVISAKVAFVSE